MAGMVTIPLAQETRVYRAIDWAGWVVLLGLAGVFLTTGITIRQSLHQAHPVAADSALALAGAITLAWLALYYALRVSAHAVVSDEGLALVHGPLRHQIAWTELARLSEWTSLEEGYRSRWITIWSESGLRLQIRQDLVADYQRFRGDILARLEETHTVPDEVTNLQAPYHIREDRRSDLHTWWAITAALALSGGLAIAFLHAILWLGVVLVTLGMFGLIRVILLYGLHQQISIGQEGILLRRGFWKTRLNWEAIYALDRQGSGERANLADTFGRLALIILLRVDRRSGVVPPLTRSAGVITIRGGSGQIIAIRERHYHHPGWIRARLRQEVERLRAEAAPLAPEVAPLPPTGPLAQGVVLPPDPMEGSSTLWLRESGEMDPFRGER